MWNTFCQTVKKVSGRLAASMSDRPARHRQRLRDRRDAQFGIAATGHQRADAVAELEPAAASAAASPPATVPATSSPGRSDTPGGIGYSPLRCSTSGRLMPDAATRISTSPGPARGRVGSSRSTSGAPKRLISIARIGRSCGAYSGWHGCGVVAVVGTVAGSRPCSRARRTIAAVAARAAIASRPRPPRSRSPKSRRGRSSST